MSKSGAVLGGGIKRNYWIDYRSYNARWIRIGNELFYRSKSKAITQIHKDIL